MVVFTKRGECERNDEVQLIIQLFFLVLLFFVGLPAVFATVTVVASS